MAAASFGGVALTCVIDQDASHRQGRSLEVIGPGGEGSLAPQFQKGFVNQRGCVERVPGILTGQLRSGELTELAIDERQQFRAGPAVVF